MKFKYKVIAGGLAASVLLPVTAFGGVVNYALYTDIVAEINGHPIRSYNIDGHTAVVAEDLRGYGFWAVWNPVERTLDVTRAMKDGLPETPVKFPEYTPEALTHKVGEKAKPVYSTDIVTYIAGEEAPSYNIGGETIIWMESLKPYGTLVWNPDARKAEFTLSGNPMSDKLAELKKNVDDWKEIGGAGSSYETIESQFGTLFVGAMTGTPHGASRIMTFVKTDGTTIDILNLLPMSGLGQRLYANPRDIKIDGSIITFVTPVNEGSEDGTVKEWGDTLCKVDINTGKLISAQPLEGVLETWTANSANSELEQGNELYLKAKRTGADVSVTEGTLPKGVSVEFTEKSITVHNYASELNEDTSYGKAYKALSALNLPSVTDDENIPDRVKQLDEVRKYCNLTYNRSIINYEVHWSQGNGHRDLCFEFFRISLADGDEVSITIKDIN
ncbi:MAG: hypothetical protein IJF98_04850 [Firmicutes bacterium]|nr:hypothetical protein [Bacillota bacterium]